MRRVVFAFVAALNCLAVLASSGTRAQDVVKVAVTPFGLPVAGLNARTKAVEGIAPELMTTIAKDAGFRVEFQPYVIGAIAEALLQKKRLMPRHPLLDLPLNARRHLPSLRYTGHRVMRRSSW